MVQDWDKLKQYLVERHFERGEGIHGVRHWMRVEANGLMLAEHTGADPLVVRLFAWFHDACRFDNGIDADHGARAGALARLANGEFMGLDAARLERLAAACEGHTHRRTHEDATIATCWDADRLDLVRLGIMVDPNFLATAVAGRPEMIREAQRRFAESHAEEREARRRAFTQGR